MIRWRINIRVICGICATLRTIREWTMAYGRAGIIVAQISQITQIFYSQANNIVVTFTLFHENKVLYRFIQEINMTDNELTYQIRGAIFDVYNTLGPGLLESVYEEALVFELQQRGLQVDRQVEVPINYKGNILKTALRLDLLIGNQVIVELKSVEDMKPVYAKQLLTYLRLMDKKIGLLVNFSSANIREGIVRLIN